MKNITLSVIALLMLFTMACESPKQQERLTDSVDPFIGTGAHGHVFPGATTPFGMVQLSPVNGTQGWDWVSGYHTTSDEVVGFAHMCLSGTGIGDLADLLILPTNKAVVSDTIEGGKNFLQAYKSKINHVDEKAEPGYYKVKLQDSGLKTEFTTSKRVGMHRYSQTEKGALSVIVDLGFAIHWDRPEDLFIQQESETLFTGYRKSSGWSSEQWLYFAIETDRPVKQFNVVEGGLLSDKKETKVKDTRAVLSFDDVDQLQLKVGLSSASINGAIKSIQQEMPDWNFTNYRQLASDSWEKELNKIKVETPNQDNKTIFYTAMYHSMLAPYLHSDLNNEYKGMDGKVHKAEGYDRYTVFSLWDTFRANHPLFTLIQADKVNDFIHSFMSIYNEAGLLPVWELVGSETMCMIGYHSIPVITDAWEKGLIKDIDGKELLKAMVNSAMTDIQGLAHYRKYNYIPADLENKSVSITLEYAYDDWCIAHMAKMVGDNEVYNTFMKRAASYKNLFNPATGFMQGRLANGEWKGNFDPLFSDHNGGEYMEGNGWQYSWFVPHDVKGLINLHGGNQAFVTKLDSLFEIKEDLKGAHSSPDISGLIGQYAHGNEPSHHVAYMYNTAGMPWKTAERVDEILNTMYTTKTDGICGNEDCGQMSAWYVLSSMGFYPVNPANGVYQLGRPLFDKAEINLSNGKVFTVFAKDNNKANKYIQSAMLNGKVLNKTWFTHKDMINGGELKLVMGSEPNKNWGIEILPPSMSK